MSNPKCNRATKNENDEKHKCKKIDQYWFEISFIKKAVAQISRFPDLSNFIAAYFEKVLSAHFKRSSLTQDTIWEWME